MVLLFVLSTVRVQFDARILSDTFVLDVHCKLLFLLKLCVLKLRHDIVEDMLGLLDGREKIIHLLISIIRSLIINIGDKIEKNESPCLLLEDHLLDLVQLDNGPVLLLLLVEHFRVLEVFDQLVEALEARVSERTDLDR